MVLPLQLSNILAQGWTTPGTRAMWHFNFWGDESWTLADVMTLFFLLFTWFWDISGRDDLFLFFALHRYFQGRMPTVGWPAKNFGQQF